MNLSSLSDQELYSRARQFGQNALKWRQKFIGLLPEVNRRRLYEKKGFESIFVFAKKLGGLSEEHVRRVLNLEKRFEARPILHTMLVEGEASVNKLARVASVVTEETEEEWAKRVRVFSQNAIEAIIRDEKALNKPKNELESVRTHSSQDGSGLKFSEELTQKLLDLQKKGFDINELLLGLLNQREEAITNEKKEVAKGMESTSSRYIPVKVEEVVYKEYGNKCSIRTCQRSSETLHHTQRFALSRTHDPHYLAPLCRAHHEIAHAIDRNVWKRRQAALRC